jgi:hypothetical protein
LQTTSLVNQLFDIHRNGYRLSDPSGQRAGLAASAIRVASFSLDWISVSTILIAGSIVARSMVASVKVTTHAPHGPEVEQILSNLMALFAATRASCNRGSQAQ